MNIVNRDSESKIAILIATFNSANTLAETLESLIATAGVLSKASIILLDGGSTDYTESLIKHFQHLYPKKDLRVHRFPGVHPAERLNTFINEGEFDFAFLCHSDDIYIAHRMEAMFTDFEKTEYWACYAQCRYYKHPLDAARDDTDIYYGTHLSHPTSPEQILCEMSLWWAISWNTALIRVGSIRDQGIRLNCQRYQFANDYDFNWGMAKKFKLYAVDYPTVITRHRAGGDGPTHRIALHKEGAEIKSRIQKDLGLESFLGYKNFKKFCHLDYRYGKVWGTINGPERSDFHQLSIALEQFSCTQPCLSHFKSIAHLIRQKLVNVNRDSLYFTD